MKAHVLTTALSSAEAWLARQEGGREPAAVRLLVALPYCGTDFPLDGIAADVLIETCELVTKWFDPREARAVLGKLSEPLVATAKESSAGAIAVLAAAERQHGELRPDDLDPNYRFWKQAGEEARTTIVNFLGETRPSASATSV